MSELFVYTADASTAIRQVPAPDPAFVYDLVRPTLRHPIPPGVPAAQFSAYAAMRAAGLFRGRDYHVALIRRGSETVHYLVATPPYYRFPFMGKDDIQIGNVTTMESARGQSLAAFSVAETIRRLSAAGRRVWYLADKTNAPSIRVADKVGMSLSGVAVSVARFGVRLLGSYQLVEGNR